VCLQWRSSGSPPRGLRPQQLLEILQAQVMAVYPSRPLMSAEQRARAPLENQVRNLHHMID